MIVDYSSFSIGNNESVYFYHPLTPTDMSAFEEFILEQGAYEFLDGAINIIGHEGLLPLLEEIRRRREAGAGP